MKFHSFTVLPTTPEKLGPLLEIAYNLWFSWNWDARELFIELDEELWRESDKNPLRMLCNISQDKLEKAANDENYVKQVETVYASYKKYIEGGTWFQEQYGERKQPAVAYFSCEYGIHESLPIYSGGLGILAGDHLKSASDLGVPLVAIGLLYKQGYFRQGLDSDGQQQEFFVENDWFSMPVHLEKDKDGKPILLSMNIGTDEVFFQVWMVQVGRISLYLLDTNIPQNLPRHREITRRLYDSDRDVRIRQEILLGIGGIKALKALQLEPAVYHINEGHSAFLIFERMKDLMDDEGMSFIEAKEIVSATNLFTTHTPVPAGNEKFDPSLIEKYFAYYAEKFGLSMDEMLALGREGVDVIRDIEEEGEENSEVVSEESSEEDKKKEEELSQSNEEFCLTVLALRFASFANGVSALHGNISRGMWKSLYSEIPENEVPIGHVTNGVHTKTWLNKGFERLFVRYLKTAYVRELSDFTLWNKVDEIPNDEIWGEHKKRKKALIDYTRKYVAWQLQRRGASVKGMAAAEKILDPSVLTLGFARRFAPYKRGDLMFNDADRFAKIITDEKRPVQIILAGKAHPADNNGKAIIKRISELAEEERFKGNIVLLEDYDIDMARFLVQGVDVWLNTPVRPQEASGTSGMKAAMNGALNCSIMDGWWEEAYNGKNGWAIGDGKSHDANDTQNEIDANSLYRLLENEIVPTYYERDEDDIPVRWVEMMKETIKTCGNDFNAHRMVMDYIKNYYTVSEALGNSLKADNYKAGKELAKWRTHIINSWDDIEILDVNPPENEFIHSGSEVSISAQIKLGECQADNLIVEVYHGVLDGQQNISDPKREKMDFERCKDGISVFTASIHCVKGGHYGYAVRVLPGHQNLATEYMPELIKWSE